MSSEQLGDAIPENWSCRQTYIRNHLAMHAAIGTLLSGDERPSSLRVVDIGGGVIEPFLLAALLLANGYSSTTCTVEIIDTSPLVCAILRSLRERVPLYLPEHGDGPIVDPARESLDLATLSRLFSSPENPINPFLANPNLMAASLEEVIQIGLASHLGLPGDVAASIRQLEHHGFPARAELASMFSVREASLLETEPGDGKHNLIVANFSTQYPIMEGHSGRVARWLLAALAPDGVLQHASTYGAQARIIEDLLRLEPSLRLAFGIRELDKVRYETDVEGDPVRLRIRTDLIAQRRPRLLPALNRTTAEIVTKDVVLTHERQNLATAPLHPDDGLHRPDLVAALWMDGEHCSIARSARDRLLSHGSPLWSRISLLP